MILSKNILLQNNLNDYLHLERYVNRGSPSGFSFEYTTSQNTMPRSLVDNFSLYGINFTADVSSEIYGEQLSILSKYDMIVHPDMIEEQELMPFIAYKDSFLKVKPTASGRTVRIIDEYDYFLKMHYQRLLGRINRVLEKDHAISSIEVSSIISNQIDRRILPNFFYFMREISAKVVEIPFAGSKKDWGIVVREPLPYPNDGQIKFVIPCFSLFSKDIKRENDPTLLCQLFELQNKKIEDFLFENLISPIMTCYFSTILNCGMQMDAQAQNTSIGIDENFQIVGIVFKDAESIDKDIPLIEKLGLNIQFKSNKFKCLTENEYYAILHSYFFDFKLGEYLITPIIEEAKLHYKFNEQSLIERIKEHNSFFINKLPLGFFPASWYNYAHVVLDRTKPRPWESHSNPKYRKI